MRVDQWLPRGHFGDAIGDEALGIRTALRRAGFSSDLFALEVDEEVRGEFLPFEDRPQGTKDDVAVLHFALPSPLTEALRGFPGRKVIIYHNITPASYFFGLDEELVRIAVKGREELGSLAAVTDLALGDSEYNRLELEEAGFRRTGVLPILLDFERYQSEPNPVLSEMLGRRRVNFLFVGRIFPNKRFEDLVRMAFFYKKYVSEDFRFIVVGRAGRMARYQQSVQLLAHEWGLLPSEFTFTGHLAWEDLLACYQMAHVFVSMSEHEGFAVPLVESMLLEVPVMAYRAGAVPDTLGDSGVQFSQKKYEELAEMGHLLATDEGLREGVLAGQRQRLERFRPQRVEAELINYISHIPEISQ
jgi:glycosyltransferase involved in cell wall biosynthesis